MSSIPFTERRNVLTMNVDTNTKEGTEHVRISVESNEDFVGIVNLLHECNMQIFNGYEDQKVLIYYLIVCIKKCS